MKEREYLIAICSFLPFGPIRTKLLIQYFSGAKNVWLAKEKDLINVGISKQLVLSFLKHRNEFNPDNFFTKLTKLSINTVTFNDKNYPSNLVGLDDSPLVLYHLGKLQDSDVDSIAIVGSRKVTSYGKEVTKMIASELCTCGIAIVSGLAFGVDLEAHKNTLDVGGRCIAVLASGVDMITPRSNEWLGRKIISSGGVIISEYPPGTIPQKQFFPYRNRIISGISKAVVVIEGEIKSGTIHTASHAAKQGRTVFAVPGQITSLNSGAPHYLIQNGARPLFSVKDILDELNFEMKLEKRGVEKLMPTDKKELELYKILENEPLHIDEIARISSMSIKDVSVKLMVMELKGLIKNFGNSIYKKA